MIRRGCIHPTVRPTDRRFGATVTPRPASPRPSRPHPVCTTTHPMLVSHISSFGASTVAALVLTASATAATFAPQDLFEPNDTCATPALISLGTTTGLTLGPDDDYFLVPINENSNIVVEAVDTMGVHYNVVLFEVGCTALLDTSSGVISHFDCGGAARDVVVQVRGSGTVNAPYELTVTSTTIVDDGFEDNDDCASGTLISIQTFTTPNLVVTECDEDFFAARLQASGTEIRVDILFDHVDGDLDVELWNLGCTTLLASSTSTDDNESLHYANTSNPPMPEAVVIRTFLKNGVGYNTYALTVCFGTTSSPTMGTQICEGQANATGRPGTLCARGDIVALNNNVDLYVVDLPSGSAGYFITSPTMGFTAHPAGSMGNLCLDTPGRYSFHVQFTGTGSAVFYGPWLPITPVAGGGFAPVLGGQRQFWQYWYRDSAGGVAVSNFSSAICIDFQ